MDNEQSNQSVNSAPTGIAVSPVATESQTESQAAPRTAPTGVNHESTSGVNGPFPAELAGWNWGAFFFTWIWGIGHNVWLSLLVFLPVLNVIMPFVLGFKGNEWAWQHKKYASVEAFKKTENTWKKWGFGLLIFIILFYVVMIGAALTTFWAQSRTPSSYDNTRLMLDEQTMPAADETMSPTPNQTETPLDTSAL